MAWFQVHNKLLPLPHVPHHRFSTSIIVLVLMIMCPLLLSSSQAKPCKCSGSDDGDPRDNTTINTTTLDQMLGYIFVPGSGLFYNNTGNNTSNLFYSTLRSFRNITSGTKAVYLSNGCYFILHEWIELWEKSNDGTILHEASFTVSFSMSVYPSSNNNKQQQQVGGGNSSTSSLYFGILPARILPILQAPPSSDSLNSPPTSATRTVNGSNISINIRIVDDATDRTASFNSTYAIVANAVFIEISIQPPESSSGEMSSYTVWIDYDRDRKQLTVYAIDAGKPKPDSPIITIPRAISNMTTQFGSTFGLFSSLEQLLQIHTWESTVEVLPGLDQSRGKLSTVITVVVAVGPSLALAAAVATIVYCYFNSKYRTWKKDLDQLAKSMQSLPGVPIQVNFRDIQKATNNFHETTKLGRGGFGAVYRCRLPAPVKGGGGEALEVAVKKFTRDHNRRYEDFLAEVSIINRLRHKNIVPLIGWSYNKGEPLLVYEYMPNGSLDQHLFGRSRDRQQRSPICQWETRYNIVMDVATGLQYVHHEYEPMVLHRDIKASNIMIDSSFHGRLGDFGLACTVDMGRNSYSERGDRPLGTYGYIPYDYIHSGKATRKTDIFAFGVLILETVTGKPPLGNPQFDHITDWVWHLHRKGKLLDAVDPVLTTDQQFDSDNAKRLLLLGLACSSPNPSERPSMMEALQVITKLASPPDVPLEKPRFVWPPEECSPIISSDYSRTTNSNLERRSTTVVEMAARTHVVSFQSFESAGNSFHHRPISQDQEYSIYRTA